jgi:DNA-binding NtrC family response regulator
LDKLSSRRASADDVAEALRLTGGNIDRAATVLGWSRNTLTKKMDEFGLRLRPPRPPRADDAS